MLARWTPADEPEEMRKPTPGDDVYIYAGDIPAPILAALDSDDPRPIIGVVRQGERLQPMPYVFDGDEAQEETK